MNKKIHMKNILVINKDNQTGEIISCKSMYELLLEAIEDVGWSTIEIKETNNNIG
jgi:hypothetical protein